MSTENQLKLNVKSTQQKDDCTSSDSSDAMPSDGEDDVAVVNNSLFSQQNFLFLFDHYLHFSKRDGFDADTDLTPGDYLKMKEVNRVILLRFLDKAIKLPGLIGFEVSPKTQGYADECQGFDIDSKPQDKSMTSADNSGTCGSDGSPKAKVKKHYGRFPIRNRECFEQEASQIDDEEIDKNFKILLQKKQHGQYLDADIVAHLEYFMNTLTFNYKCQTENPFENPDDFPALTFRPNDMLGGMSDMTMESVAEESSSSDSMIDEDEKELEKQKKSLEVLELIDIQNIGVDTQDIGQLTTPNPKKSVRMNEPYPIGKYEKNMSIKSGESPIKQLVKNEIKRQSVILVKGMSIMERNSILINPINNMDMIKKKVKYDRRSILTNKKMASPSKSSSLNSRSSSFIDDIKIQEKIVRKSINQMLPKNGTNWYPNYKLKSKYSAVFTGSPPQKQISQAGNLNKSNFKNGSMFVPGDFGSQRGANSVVFKMNPIQAAPDFCEGIIDDQEMFDHQVQGSAVANQSSAKFQNATMFSGDSILALKGKTPSRFQIPSQFEEAPYDNQSGIRDPYGLANEEKKVNLSKLENEDANSELSV